MQIIRDPKLVQIVIEKSRWEIYNLLKKKGALSAEQIAEAIDKNVSTVYRHLKKLLEAGFISEKEVATDQRYSYKVFSAEKTDAFFILSEEVEKIIKQELGETSVVEANVPKVLEYLSQLGYKPKSKKEAERAIELLKKLSIKQSSFLGELANGKEIKGKYDHNFEVTRRFLSIFLLLKDLDYKKQVEELLTLLSPEK